MTNNSSATASVRLDWAGLLFIVLLILKVNPGSHLDSPVEDWSWWWITAPLWGGFALLIIIVILGALGVVIGWGIDQRRAKRRRAEMAARKTNRASRFN